MHKGFVLGDIVGGGEVDLERVAEPVALRGRQYDAGPKPSRILDPSKRMRQCVESGGGGKYWVSVQSTRKSARA